MISSNNKSSLSGNSTHWTKSFRMWNHRIYCRFCDWWTKPIPFPGKWPEHEGKPDGYNGKSGTVHDERAAKS